jgi:hypothetical protein
MPTSSGLFLTASTTFARCSPLALWRAAGGSPVSLVRERMRLRQGR